eukprot:ctg_7466.g672
MRLTGRKLDRNAPPRLFYTDHDFQQEFGILPSQ